MRFGLCTGDLGRIERLDQLGYDYADIGASTLLPFAPESEFAPVRERLRSAPVRAEALGGFLPGNLKVVGPVVDWPRVRDYLEVTLGRAAEVGVEVVNWGSAESRMVPPGFSYARAFEQLERFCVLADEIAQRNRQTIVIEAINPRECNIVYYVRDALHLAQVVNLSRIRVLADYYHMAKQDEPMEHLLEAGAWLQHAHTSDDHRRFPSPDGYDQRRFLQYLKRAGYAGRLSFECRAPEDFDGEARRAVEYVRLLWEALDLRP